MMLGINSTHEILWLSKMFFHKTPGRNSFNLILNKHFLDIKRAVNDEQ